MSRLWDTPELWARSEADEALRDMPDVEPGVMADSFERSAGSYDGELKMVALIAAELRRRAAAGIRFWPGPHLPGDSTTGGSDDAEAKPAERADQSLAELLDDEIPW